MIVNFLKVCRNAISWLCLHATIPMDLMISMKFEPPGIRMIPLYFSVKVLEILFVRRKKKIEKYFTVTFSS